MSKATEIWASLSEAERDEVLGLLKTHESQGGITLCERNAIYAVHVLREAVRIERESPWAEEVKAVQEDLARGREAVRVAEEQLAKLARKTGSKLKQFHCIETVMATAGGDHRREEMCGVRLPCPFHM